MVDLLYGLGAFGVVLALAMLIGLKWIDTGIKVGLIALGMMGVAYVIDAWLWVVAVGAAVGIAYGVLDVVAAVRKQSVLQMLDGALVAMGVLTHTVEALPEETKATVKKAVKGVAEATGTKAVVDAAVDAAKAAPLPAGQGAGATMTVNVQAAPAPTAEPPPAPKT